MKHVRRFVAAGPLVTAIVVTVLSSHGGAQTRAAAAMAAAANTFLASLTPDQRAKAVFRFDDAERFDWNESPRPRNGLQISALTDQQRELGIALLKTGVGEAGYQKVEMIRARDPFMELLYGGNRFGPERYFFSIFGTPSGTEPWGWRFEGHHISLNYTIAGGEVLSVGPLFFGARPADLQHAGEEGRADVKTWNDTARQMLARMPPALSAKVLAGEEDKARALVQSLDEKQRAIAIFERPEKRTADMISGVNNRTAARLDRPGLYGRQMNQKQRGLLVALIEESLSHMPADVASARSRRLAKELDEVAFSWTGGTEPGQAHFYTVQGPWFLVDYAQGRDNLTNHTHTLWRELDNDFGLARLPSRRSAQ